MPSDGGTLILRYSTSPDFFWSGVIRRMCHSPFSHVDIVLPGEGLLGASGRGAYKVGARRVVDPGGVRVRPFEPWPYLYKIEVRVKTDKAEAVRLRWRSQVGKPFDHGALWKFLSDKPGTRDWRDESKWFCSEGIVWAMEREGAFRYELMVAKDRVSPADSLLIVNPMIVPEDVVALRRLIARETA